MLLILRLLARDDILTTHSMVLQWGPSLEKKGLRFDVKVSRAERQAKPPRAMLSSCG
jgi:hypothetical protein